MIGLRKRVAYHEVDQMRYLYHGNYAAYYHASRTELLRTIGLNDAALEEKGILLPVINLSSHFIKPARYDDDLLIVTKVEKVTPVKIFFKHKIYCNNELINEGETVLACADIQTRKPLKIEEEVREKLLGLNEIS